MSKTPFDRRGAPAWAFPAYLAGFFIAWTGYVLWVFPLVHSLGEASFSYAIAGDAARLVLWIAPVLLYLRCFDDTDILDALELRKNWRRGVVFGVATSLLLFTATALRHGFSNFDADRLTWNLLLSTSVIGVFEEVPFRGFILQKVSRTTNFWFANTLTSMIFVAFHLPGWLSLGLFEWQNAEVVFVLSFLFGALYRYSGSLIAPIVAHSAYDVIAILLSGHR